MAKSPIIKSNTANVYRLLTNGIALSPFHLGPTITTATTDPTDYSTFGNASSLILNYNTVGNNGRIWVNDNSYLVPPPDSNQDSFEGVWREVFSNDNAIVSKSTNVAIGAQNTNYAISFGTILSQFPSGTFVNTTAANIDIDNNLYDTGYYFLTPYSGVYHMVATLSMVNTAVNNFIIEFWVNGAFYQGGISRFDASNQVKIIYVEMIASLAANDIVQVVCKFSGPATLNLNANASYNRWYIKTLSKWSGTPE